MAEPDENTIFSRTYPFGDNLRFVVAHIWRRDKLLVPIALLTAILRVVTPFLSIFLPKAVIDAVSGSQAEASPAIRTILLLSLAIAVTNILANIGDKHVQRRAQYNRSHYNFLSFQKTMRMDYTNLENPQGQNAKQKASEVFSSQRGGGETFILHSSNLLQHLLGLTLYASITARLNIGIIIGMIGISAISYWATRMAQLYEAKQKNAIAELNRKRWYVIDETQKFANAKDLRLYNMTRWFSDHLEYFFNAEFALKARSLRRYFLADGVGDLCACLRDGLAYFYLIRLVFSGIISLGEFTLYFAAIAGISNWTSQITADLSGLRAAHLDINHFRSYLDIPDPTRPESNCPLPESTPEIIFEHVYFHYPGSEDWVLEDFNLTIPAGQKLALVGSNGAGKTTVVKLLCGLYQPVRGRLLINGVDSRSYNREQYFRLFSVAFQDVRALAFDVSRNVALSMEEDIDQQRVIRSLNMAGLSKRVQGLPQGLATPLTRSLDESGVELSGGQTQRLMLARALYKSGQVVIMDEPTAALDPIAEADMYERYNEMVGGKTSVYISHRLASTRFCDRIAFIANGKILELGSHAELLRLGGEYARMFEIQSHYYQLTVES